MIPDYRAAEQAYYQKHGYVPAHHLIKLHREVVERNPWIVKSLMTAFTESKRLWLARRRHLVDTTPWLLAELVETATLFGDDWPPYGLEPNLQMLTDFCQGQYAQKLVGAPSIRPLRSQTTRALPGKLLTPPLSLWEWNKAVRSEAEYPVENRLKALRPRCPTSPFPRRRERLRTSPSHPRREGLWRSRSVRAL